MLSNKYRKGIMRELTIKETQQVSLEILYTITQICEKQGLRYSLIYGTLIGAIGIRIIFHGMMM